jgi:pyruvate dehydrogenase E1 component alpha subunit
MPGVTVDGNDVLAVRAATKEAADRARAGGGPTLIIADTYRFYGHNVGEAVAYRTKDEVDERRKGDPIPRFENWLAEGGYLDESARKQVWDDVNAEVEASVKFALESPDPDPATAMEGLYSDTRASWSMQ